MGRLRGKGSRLSLRTVGLFCLSLLLSLLLLSLLLSRLYLGLVSRIPPATDGRYIHPSNPTMSVHDASNRELQGATSVPQASTIANQGHPQAGLKTSTSLPPRSFPSAFYPPTASSQYLPSTKHDHHHPFKSHQNIPRPPARGKGPPPFPRRPL